MTDTSGVVVWSATYNSFGNTQIDIETVVNNLRFAGQYFDKETDLHYNWNRYYAPTIGRYTRQDPAEDGLNLYVYVMNNPLTGIDPEGLMTLEQAQQQEQQEGSYFDDPTRIFLAGDFASDAGSGYVLNNPVNLIDPLGLLNLAETYAKFEIAMKPYVVGGALVVTGGVTTVAGAVTTYAGFISTSATGPAGVLVGATGLVVTGAGVAGFALGLDVYSDELRRRFGLPEWFDVMRNFELLPKHEEPKPSGESPCK